MSKRYLLAIYTKDAEYSGKIITSEDYDGLTIDEAKSFARSCSPTAFGFTLRTAYAYGRQTTLYYLRDGGEYRKVSRREFYDARGIRRAQVAYREIKRADEARRRAREFRLNDLDSPLSI